MSNPIAILTIGYISGPALLWSGSGVPVLELLPRTDLCTPSNRSDVA